MYALGAASVGALTLPAPRLRAGSVVCALAPVPINGSAASAISVEAEVAPVTGMYVPAAARTLAPAPPSVPAGSVIGAVAAAGV